MNPYVIDMIKNNYLEKSDYLEIILNFFSQIKQIPDNKIHKTFILGEAFNWKLSLRHYYSEFEICAKLMITCLFRTNLIKKKEKRSYLVNWNWRPKMKI